MTKSSSILTAGLFLIVALCHAQLPIKRFSSVTASYSFNDKIYLVANDGISGDELWTSDGTPEGTVLLKDIREGHESGNPQFLTWYNGRVYFAAYDAKNYSQLWATDGTKEGTVMVANPEPANSYTGGTSPMSLTVFNGYLYFTSALGKLYKTNGLPGGTTVIDDISYGRMQMLSIANNKLYYYKSSDMLQWTDGTAVNTIDLPLDIEDTYFQGLYSTGSQLYAMRASTYLGHIKLYALNHTTNVWSKIFEVKAPTYGSQEIDKFTAVGNKLFFTLRKYYNNETPADELWISDGTLAGTTMLKSFKWDPHWADSEMMIFKPFNGTLYFRGGSGGDNAFWKSDGTTDGTVKVHKVQIMAPNYQTNVPVGLHDRLYFAGVVSDNFSNAQPSLWSSDGTEANTRKEMELSTNLGSLPYRLAVAGGLVYFVTGDQYSGTTFWSTKAAPEINVKAGLYGEKKTGETLAFSGVQVNACQSIAVTIRNDGAKALPLGSVHTLGSDFYVKGTVPEILLPGQNFIVDVYFSPSSNGLRVGTLVITSGDDNEGIFSIKLSGTVYDGEVTEPQPFCTDFQSLKHVITAGTSSKSISLSKQSVTELQPAGTEVGTLSIPSSASVLSYSLVGGDGDTHNDFFVIEGTQLKTKRVFQFGDKNFHSVRVRANLSDGSSKEDYFSIEVTNQLTNTPAVNCGVTLDRLNYQFNDIAFSSTGKMFLITNRGQIHRSADGGLTWTVIPVGGNYRLDRIFFMKTTGYIVGENILLKSEDDGVTWFQLYVPGTFSLFNSHKAFFFDENAGYVTNSGGALFYTADGGRTWEQRGAGYLGSDNYGSLAFTSKELGFAIKGSAVYKTQDGGRNWEGVDFSALGWLSQPRDITFINDKEGFIVISSEILRTDDGGATWKKAQKPYGDFYKIRFINATIGYAVGYGSFAQTQDAGKTWIYGNSPGGMVTGIAAQNDKLYATTLISVYTSSSTGRSLSVSTDGGSVWKSMQYLGEDDFSMISFSTPQIGFASAEYYNYKTSDGGVTWNRLQWNQRVHEPVVLSDGTMLISNGINIYRSADQGETVTSVFESPTGYDNYKPVGKLIKLDDNNIISHNGYHIYKSTDAGLTWNYITGDEGGMPATTEMFFVSPLIGYAVELFGTVFKTTDGGLTWTRIYDVDSESSRIYTTLFFVNEQLGFKAAETLAKTTDGGLTWTTLFTNFNTTILRVHFTDVMHGYVVGKRNYLFETFDGGVTWKQYYVLADDDIMDADFRDGAIYLTGKRGYMARYTSGGPAPLMPGYIHGDQTVCVGTIGIYNLAANYESSYTWTIPNASVRDDASSIQVHFSAPGEYSFAVNAFNSCGTSETRTLKVKAETIAAPIVSGSATVEPKQKEIYTVSNVQTSVDYAWQISTKIPFTVHESTEQMEVTWPDHESQETISIFALDSETGCRIRSEDFAVEVVLTVGTEEESHDGVSVFPNPTSQEIQLISETSPLHHARVYTLSGKLVLEKNLDSYTTESLSFRNLPSGVYVLKLLSDDHQVFIRRIVKR